MNCIDVEAAMIDFLDKNLDKDHSEEIEKHLLICERCMEDVKEFQDMLEAMQVTEMEKPDDNLRINFYHMLRTEINKQKKSGINFPESNASVSLWSSPWIKIAAGFALLICGALIDHMALPSLIKEQPANQLGELKSEVLEMKKMLMLTMLNEESPSQRIKAVNYSEEISNPDQKVIGALFHTLNKDKNVNVRLAALYSLARFSGSQLVRDSLVKSLDSQSEPIIQIVMMNILTEKKEMKAVEPMRKIMLKKNVMREVKETAEKSIDVLL